MAYEKIIAPSRLCGIAGAGPSRIEVVAADLVPSKLGLELWILSERHSGRVRIVNHCGYSKASYYTPLRRNSRHALADR